MNYRYNRPNPPVLDNETIAWLVVLAFVGGVVAGMYICYLVNS
jgi:hypothetical protein